MQQIIELSQAPGADPGMPSAQRRRTDRLRERRWGMVLAGCGVALLPWLVVLATGLPRTYRASHWPAAWVGLDALEAVGLITTGVLISREDRRLAPVAAATATLLTVDAWFDTMTASGAVDLGEALAMAAIAELPLAAVCVRLAVRALSQPA